jgi:putative transposase
MLIDYDRLKKLCGFDDFESFQAAHRRWVETAAGEELSQRVSSWTQAVAAGSESFVEKIKKQRKALAIGQRILPATDGWELRQEASSYNHNPFFEGQKVDINHENTYPWEEIATISMS